jgi:hypothetical protein
MACYRIGSARKETYHINPFDLEGSGRTVITRELCDLVVFEQPETLRRRLFSGECHCQDRRSVAALPAAVKSEVRALSEGAPAGRQEAPRWRIFSSPLMCDFTGSILTSGEEDVNFNDANPYHPAITLRQRNCFGAS